MNALSRIRLLQSPLRHQRVAVDAKIANPSPEITQPAETRRVLMVGIPCKVAQRSARNSGQQE